MISPPLFIYGTLKSERVRDAVLGAEAEGLRLVEAQVKGYEVRAVHGAHYPMLHPRQGATTMGFVLEGVTQAALALLDRFEGRHYQRHQVQGYIEDKSAELQIYLPDNTIQPAGPWSFEEWEQHYQDAFFQRDFNPDGVTPPDNAHRQT